MAIKRFYSASYKLQFIYSRRQFFYEILLIIITRELSPLLALVIPSELKRCTAEEMNKIIALKYVHLLIHENLSTRNTGNKNTD